MHSARNSLFTRHVTTDEKIRRDELSRRWRAPRPNQNKSNDLGRDSNFGPSHREIEPPFESATTGFNGGKIKERIVMT